MFKWIKNLFYRNSTTKLIDVKLKKESENPISIIENRLMIIEKAKDYYIAHSGKTGMCNSIAHVLDSTIDFVYSYIPEFTSKNLVGKNIDRNSYWWPLKDSESRIKAFDKLIMSYKYYIWKNIYGNQR